MPKILAIDDQKVNLTELKYKIKFIFPEIQLLLATHPEEGFDLAVKENPDVIILDIMMPHIDGYEICRRLKKDKRTAHTPVIFLTVLDNDKENRIKAVEVGGDAFLTRPVDEIELKVQINAMLKVKIGNEKKLEEKIRLEELVEQRTRELKSELEKRKKTEIKLRENEEKYRELIEGSPDVIYIISSRYGATYGTSQVQKLLGIKEEEFIKDPFLWIKLVHPDDQKLVKRVTGENYEGSSFDIEYRIKDANGKWHWIHDRSISRRKQNDEVIVQGIATDITERKLAKEKIRESEEKYRLLVTQMDQGLAVHEGIFNDNGKMIDYRFIDFNKSFEKQTGLKRNKTIGKTFLQVLPGSEPYWVEKYESVLKTGQALHLESYAREFGKYFAVVAYRIRSNQFATVVTDITKKRRDFKELYLHNLRQEALLKIFRYNSSDTPELINYALQQTIHLTESKHGILFLYDESNNQISIGSCSKQFEKNKQVLNSVFKLDEIGIWGEAAKQCKPLIINNPETLENTYHCIFRRNRVPKNILSVPVQIKNEIKAIIGVSDKNEDYTEKDIKQISLLIEAAWTVIEKSRHIEELEAAKEKAEESDRLKSAFLANMSHEIRTPMNGIMGFAELLKDPKLTKDEQKNYLAIIEKSGERMLDTINDLIDISRIESKSVEVNFSRFNINDQMNYLYHFFRLETRNKGLQLNFSNFLHDKAALIISDKDKVNAILMNLIKNSIKYTNQGRIEFGYFVKDTFLEFYVKDTGVGIQKDRQEAIFERFVQADISTSRPYEGVGLGLSIAKAYVEMLDGQIGVESEEGKGSLFFFKIPYKTMANHIFEDKIPALQNNNPENILKELTILVAEDDETGRLYMEHLLGEKCRKLLFAKNGIEAVKCYKENEDIDIVLMDMKMPEMDGYSATKKIKEINKHAIIIGQSAFALQGDKEKSIEAGCDGYLTKPLEKVQLLQTIRKLQKQ